MLSKDDIKKSSEIAVEQSKPIVTRLVVEDSLFYKALKALAIKPIEVVAGKIKKKRKNKRGKRK